jgi:hypothetical protein
MESSSINAGEAIDLCSNCTFKFHQARGQLELQLLLDVKVAKTLGTEVTPWKSNFPGRQ